MIEDQERDFQYYMRRAQEVKDQMTLGVQAIKSDHVGYMQRVKDKLHGYGIGGKERESMYSLNEQGAMQTSDNLSRGLTRSLDIGMGLGQVGLSLLPNASKIGRLASYGSIATGLMGFGGLTNALGSMSMLTNPFMMAGTLGLQYAGWGIQESLMTPLANTRQFQSSSFINSRNSIGGLQSGTGRGGLTMSQSLGIGRLGESIRVNNKDISADMLNEFIKSGTQLDSMKFMNSDKAVENMGKYLGIMTKLAKQFKGKESELMQAMQQFSSMGMTLDQSKNAIQTGSSIGTMLNINPGRIMTAGAGFAQTMMGSNISQSSGYFMGANNFINAEIMRQRGQITKTQSMNFGGSEGISNILSSSQMAVMNSSYADIFLKSIYTRDGGINNNARKDLVSGTLGLREAQKRSQNITGSPLANMQYQFNKESIIDSLGENIGDVSNNIFNNLATRNPFGNSLEGRAKLALKMGIAPNKQAAMLFAQNNLAYNPLLTQITKQQQNISLMAGQDPYFNSIDPTTKNFGVATNILSQQWEETWNRGIIGQFNPGTVQGRQLYRDLRSPFSAVADPIIKWFGRSSQPRETEQFRPFSTFKTKDDISDTIKYLRSNPSSGQTKEQTALKKIGEYAVNGNELDYDESEYDYLIEAKNKIRNDLTVMVNGGWGGLAGKFQGITDPKEQLRIIEEQTKKFQEENPEYRKGVKVLNKTLGPQDITKTIGGWIGQFGFGDDAMNKARESLADPERLVLKQTIDSYSHDSITKYGPGGFLYDAFRGSRETDLLNNFGSKFNAADLETRTKMSGILDNLGGSKKDEMILSGEEKDLLGMEKISKDEISFLKNQTNLKEFDKLIKDPNAKNDQRVKDLSKSISTIFGSDIYKQKFSKSGLDENIGENLVKKFFGLGIDGSADMHMTKQQLKDLKAEAVGTGLEDVLKFTKFDSSTGTLDMKPINKDSKKWKDAAEMLMGRNGGMLGNLNAMSNAKDFWDAGGRGNEAKTIQDFAVAVAKGVQMANSNKYSLNDWNQTSQDKSSDQIIKP